MLPVLPGRLTNQVHIEAALTVPQDHEFSFEVQGDRIPELSIEQVGTDGVLLKVWAEPGRSYVLERSIFRPGGPPYLWSDVTNFLFAPPVFQMDEKIALTNPGYLYRLRQVP